MKNFIKTISLISLTLFSFCFVISFGVASYGAIDGNVPLYILGSKAFVVCPILMAASFLTACFTADENELAEIVDACRGL